MLATCTGAPTASKKRAAPSEATAARKAPKEAAWLPQKPEPPWTPDEKREPMYLDRRSTGDIAAVRRIYGNDEQAKLAQALRNNDDPREHPHLLNTKGLKLIAKLMTRESPTLVQRYVEAMCADDMACGGFAHRQMAQLFEYTGPGRAAKFMAGLDKLLLRYHTTEAEELVAVPRFRRSEEYLQVFREAERSQRLGYTLPRILFA